MLLAIFFLSFLCMFLLFIIFNYRRNINKISSALYEIQVGNLNRRINLRNADRIVRRLGAELNSLTDRFTETMMLKEKLEDSQKKLVANISHDLRTPLTSILGYIEVLKEDDSLTDEDRKTYIDIVENKGNSLFRLVQEFFEMSRLDSDDQIYKFQRINICAKLKESLAEFYQDFIDNDIEPVIAFPDCSVYVWGDETGIHRVMQNLLSNALKYGFSGRIIGIGLREEENRVWVDIWDKGKGIGEADIKYIFERLYTAEYSRNDKLRGSGLGLAIVKKLVSRMNGEVTVSSVPWEKTVFSFSLPKSAENRI